MKYSRFIGIDTGFSGAIAVLEDENPPKVWDCPTYKVERGRELDFHAMPGLIPDKPAFAIIEIATPMPRDGKVSACKFVGTYYAWRMLLAVRGITWEDVRPIQWQNAIKVGVKKKSDKEASRRIATQMFPELSNELVRVEDHGRAEALLMAEYGRRLCVERGNA